jgi:hypothetical protein
MNFGGLGGLGGRASSFPQRSGAPTSNIVEALPFENQDDWLADWQRRYGEAMSAANSGYWRDSTTAPERSGAGDAEHPFRQNEHPWRDTGSSAEWLGSAIGSTRPPEDYRTWRSEWVDTSGAPDTRALDAERERMNLAYENRTRNQQAYDSMLNNGQVNGLIGPGYSNANFGSVSGQGAAQLPEIEGVNMDWASGVYNPQQASGMYGSTGRTYKQGWL